MSKFIIGVSNVLIRWLYIANKELKIRLCLWRDNAQGKHASPVALP